MMIMNCDIIIVYSHSLSGAITNIIDEINDVILCS